jgi:hypothetical protein
MAYYMHKYSKTWEEKYQWIAPSKTGINHFFCKACQQDLIGGLGAVKKHDSGKKHCQKIKTISTLKPIDVAVQGSTVLDKKIKELEIRISSFVTEHNIAFNSVDHLTELVKEAGKCPEAARRVKLKRTKCF